MLRKFLDDVKKNILYYRDSVFPAQKNTSQTYEAPSVFKKFLPSTETMAPYYISVRQAIGLADDALRMARRRIILVNSIKTYDAQMREWECVHRLSDEEIMKFNAMLDRFSSLLTDRKKLIDQLTGFDSSIQTLERLGEEADRDMPQILDAEENQNNLRRDIVYLEDEKAELEGQQSFLVMSEHFINRFAAVMVGLFVFAAVFVGYRAMTLEVEALYPSTIFVFLIIMLSAVLYFFRKRVVYSLDINYRKQKRAVRFLNRKNTVCAYYNNFLRYEYQKFHVRNGRNLQRNINEFDQYKHVTARIDALRKIMYDTQNDIESFLKDHDIDNLPLSLENSTKNINLMDQKHMYEEAVAAKKRSENDLVVLDTKQQEQWSKLTVLREKDYSRDKLVEKIMEMYLDEVSKL